jgi:hypothetical protein
MAPDLAIGPAALFESPASARPTSWSAGGDTLGRPTGPQPSSLPASGESEAPLAQLALAAASERFPTRTVEIATVPDSATGRIVYRISDRLSGEVLMQEPAESLLRFYATARAATDGPLVTIDA